MSEDPKQSNNPILSLMGNMFLFLVPAALIVMLGIVGLALLAGSGVEPQEVVESPPAAAASPAPAALEASESAAAETATAETADASDGSGVAPDVMALGKTAYATCAACHGPDGQGLRVGPMLMAPSLTGAELLIGDPDAAILVVLKGIAKENMDYMGMMAPLGAGLDDEKIAAVLTYTRNEWGNSAPPVTVEEVAAARAKFAEIDAPAGVKRDEVLQIVEAAQAE